MKKIGIIGHFGGDKIFLDGQTIKTKTLRDELCAKGYDNIICVDTYYNKTAKLKLLIDTAKCFLSCDVVVVSLSANGLKVYLPLLYVLKKLQWLNVYHHVVGGSIANFASKHPLYIRCLRSLDVNWVQSPRILNELRLVGVENCEVIPNFRRLTLQDAKMDVSEGRRSTFCVFSRVAREKGIDDAISAVGAYNRSHEEKICLNIWGQVADSYADDFDKLLSIHGDYVTYRGCVGYKDSVSTITDHVALLFPTHWDGEGFPGTVVDAYAAALPVIASDWHDNSLIIDNFQTGWVYPNERIGSLYESLVWAMEHKQEMLHMRRYAHKKAEEYMPSKWVDKIVSAIENG